jgi:hypothetical protein
VTKGNRRADVEEEEGIKRGEGIETVNPIFEMANILFAFFYALVDLLGIE